MAYQLFDYVNHKGENEFKKWTEGLEPTLRAKLNQKLDMLKLQGEDLLPVTLTDSGVPGILKIRVQGGVKLRPLLCRGPRNIDAEFTLLMGAKEVGSKWDPTLAPEKAQQKKQELLSDLDNRRVSHERINKHPGK